MTVTTEKLNTERIYKVIQIREAEEPTVYVPVVPTLDPSVKICLERAEFVTASYKHTEWEPWILRRARALDHLLRNMTIYILDGEQIVGNYASTPHSLPTYPEFSYRWLEKGLDDEYKDTVDDEEKKRLKEIKRYWATQSVESAFVETMPEDLKRYLHWTGATYNATAFWPLGHMTPNYKDRVFPLGFSGLLKEVREYRAMLSSSDPEYTEKKDFYDAAEISFNAVIAWIHRYAELARSRAAETEGKLKEDFETVARVCSRIAENAPETFHEALQVFWFCHLLITQISWVSVGMGQRFDQIFYPYYKKEQEAGTITYERAVELFEFLWIKLDDLGQINPIESAMVQVGGTKFQNATIGGVDEHGNDATNDLSFAAIDATMNIRTPQPSLCLRYHDKIDPKLVDKTIDCIASGMGMPAFFNDKTAIDYHTETVAARMGGTLPPEAYEQVLALARSWAPTACVGGGNPSGMVVQGTLTTEICPGILNFLKCFEYVMYQGVEPETGEQLGLRTADPRTFESYEEFLDAFLQQMRFQLEQLAKVYEITEKAYQERTPRPFASILMSTPIMRGRDATHQGDMTDSEIFTMACVNAGDSLAAVKKLVFDDKSVTMDELIKACATNWEGYEDLHRRCLEVPKFGNDNDYVDYVLYNMYRKASETIKSVTTHFGTGFRPEATLAGAYFYGGLSCGATPDGRTKRETVADGQLSPMHGRDVKGPTAVIKSISKVNVLDTWNQLVNQKVQPALLKGANKKMFANYIKTWAQFPTWHIQFNCQDQEELKDAQVHPEKHANLVVRVAGYSAHFVDLTSGLQRDIIRRTEHQFA